MGRPTIEVVSAWYNEEILAPFFLHHYSYADRIHILYDMDSDDGTLSVLQSDPKVILYPIRYCDGIDWEVKSTAVNEIVGGCKSEWVIAVDADEFIWPVEETMPDFLERQSGDVVWAAMWAVYRHESEADLDPSHPSMLQRCHGDRRVGITYDMNGWVKPCIVRPSANVEWSCGIHSYKDDDRIKVASEFVVGAHWAMADPELAVRRRLGQARRQSQSNIDKRHGYQNFNITEAEIRDECRRHEQDEKLF